MGGCRISRKKRYPTLEWPIIAMTHTWGESVDGDAGALQTSGEFVGEHDASDLRVLVGLDAVVRSLVEEEEVCQSRAP